MYSNWLFKLWISFAIHCSAMHVGSVPENIVVVLGINELKSFFVLYYLTVLVYTETILHLGG